MAKVKGKKLNKQTLNEFQAWLSGVEEMQDGNWVPTLEQWELIRRRIELIIPDEVTPNIQTTVGGPFNPNLANIPNFPMVPDSFGNTSIMPSTTQLQPGAPPSYTPPSQLGSEKTPDMEAGDYKSGFA